ELEESDGRDILRGIEVLQFTDGCFLLASDAVPLGEFVGVTDGALEPCGQFGEITLSYELLQEDEPIVATIAFNAGVTATQLQWVWQFGEDGEEWEPSP